MRKKMTKFDDAVSGALCDAQRFNGKPITPKSLERIIGLIQGRMEEHVSDIEPLSLGRLIESYEKGQLGLVIFMELSPLDYYLVMRPKSRDAIKFAKKTNKAWYEWLSRKSKSKDESQESHGKTKNKEKENG